MKNVPFAQLCSVLKQSWGGECKTSQQLSVTIVQSFLLCFPFPVTKNIDCRSVPQSITHNYSFLSGLLMVLKTCLRFGIVKHINQKYLGFALNSF